MKLKDYIALILSQCNDGADVEFDIGLDSWGDVDQASNNRIKFTISNIKEK
jgi:hypothetical protein